MLLIAGLRHEADTDGVDACLHAAAVMVDFQHVNAHSGHGGEEGGQCVGLVGQDGGEGADAALGSEAG